jgi:hypothetical protein
MPWAETCVMDNRTAFVAACERGDEPMSQLCARYEISRKTGHKWLARYRTAGWAGLADGSRARHTQPLAMPPTACPSPRQMRLLLPVLALHLFQPRRRAFEHAGILATPVKPIRRRVRRSQQLHPLVV